MFEGVTVLAGPAGCGKTERLLASYRQVLKKATPGRALWLAPNWRSAADVRQKLLGPELPACFGPNCHTFDRLGQLVLDASPLAIRPLTRLMKKQLLRQLIDEALADGSIEYLQPIAHTPGLLELLDRFISELKRLEIWPDELAAAGGAAGSKKDRELTHLYRRYQAVLNEHHLYDQEGRLWSARSLLKAGQKQPLSQLELVVVDGFTDFTRTQHEILEALAERARQMVITLPLEAEPRRRELFARPLLTLAELERRHPGLRVEPLARPAAPRWPALAHLEAHVFARARQAARPPDTRGLEIVSAAQPLGELEMIAARIKRLLVEGDDAGPVRPGDILVIFRALGEVAELAREVFAEFGIPAAVGATQSLQRAPALSALGLWLQLQLEDWPFRGLLAALGHNSFQPDWPEWQSGRAVASADALVRRLQYPSGREQLLRHVERWASQDPPPAESGSSDPAARQRRARWEQAALAWPLLKRLDETLAALPRQASPGQWSKALDTLARELGIFRWIDARAGEEGERQRMAWQRLREGLDQYDRLAAWTGESPPEWPLAELVQHVQEILRTEPLPPAHDEVGRVLVLDARSARTLSARHVFVAGLAEKAFPPPLDGQRLHSEAEYEALVERGLPLLTRSDRSHEEMLLFYEVLTRARERLTLSYPGLDESAQPLLPSPYLVEVERVSGLQEQRHINLSPIPAAADVACVRDQRVQAVARALDDDASLLAGLCLRGPAGNPADNILAALSMAGERQRRGGFGPFEGICSGAGLAARLAERYGPAYCWSTSQLEQYGLCPYKFFLDRILQLEPLGDPALEFDHLLRGRMLHGTLANLHRRMNARRGGPASPGSQTSEEFLQNAEEILSELVEDVQARTPLERALREIDRRLLTQWLAGYREQHLQYEESAREWDEPPLPAHFEVAFGPLREGAEPDEGSYEDAQVDPLSRPEPFELDCGAERVRIAGRIDRIDLGKIDGQLVFNVLDYKSGSSRRFTKNALSEGLVLQLPLYALAVEEHLLAGKGVIAWEASYWYLKDQGAKRAIAFQARVAGTLQPEPKWADLRNALRQRVLRLVRGIRGGQFPMHSADDECTSRCEFHTVCRVNQTRALHKLWEPPAAEGS